MPGTLGVFLSARAGRRWELPTRVPVAALQACRLGQRKLTESREEVSNQDQVGPHFHPPTPPRNARGNRSGDPPPTIHGGAPSAMRRTFSKVAKEDGITDGLHDASGGYARG